MGGGGARGAAEALLGQLRAAVSPLWEMLPSKHAQAAAAAGSSTEEGESASAPTNPKQQQRRRQQAWDALGPALQTLRAVLPFLLVLGAVFSAYGTSPPPQPPPHHAPTPSLLCGRDDALLAMLTRLRPA